MRAFDDVGMPLRHVSTPLCDARTLVRDERRGKKLYI